VIKLIIFDWDDVFTLGSKEGYFRCYHEALRELGVALDPVEERKRILEKWSIPPPDVVAYLLKERPGLVESGKEAVNRHLFGETFTSALNYVNGANEFLLRLRRNYILSIATGLHPGVLREHVMPRFGVPQVFSDIISTYDVEPGKRKPHPYIAQEILRRHKVGPEEAILVGDARGDVQMAYAASVTPVVVLTGHLTRKEAESLGVKHIIEDVTHLENVLHELE